MPSCAINDAAAQNVSGALFWTDDVWAGGANGWVYAGWQSQGVGEPGDARQGPGECEPRTPPHKHRIHRHPDLNLNNRPCAGVHRLYFNETCLKEGGEKWPTDNGQPRPSCDWQEMSMKTDGLCAQCLCTLCVYSGSEVF